MENECNASSTSSNSPGSVGIVKNICQKIWNLLRHRIIIISQRISLMKDQLNILIVEDDPIIAQLIEHYIHEFGHRVLDIVHNSERALDLIHNLKPDLILLDINIEGTKDGVDIAEVIQSKYEIPFIFLTALSDKEIIERVKNVKPIGYVVKPFKEADLYTSISIGMSNHAAANNKNNVSQELVNDVALSPLSFKEYKVLMDIAQGLTNEEIARQLELSKNTIKWHAQNIYSKLGVPNRTAAAQFIMSL